jgi:iron complex transport system substrate-binding protein
MYEDHWYLPKGSSWGSILLKEAQGDYLWEETRGTGSLSLSFETVFEKARDADFWITSGQFSSLKEMIDSNPHYAQFKAFKTKNVYSFSGKKGKTGGVLYYELAPNRPDLVLKDIVKLLHPELLPGYEPYFFAPLK